MIRRAAAALALAAALAVPGASSAQSARNGDDPMEPFAIGEGLYYVGASDIAAYLIGDPKGGFVLLDGGYDTTAPKVLAGIRKLGFDPKQVKLLINTHAHLDHAGGLAELKAATGAPLWASAADAVLLEAGGKGDFFLGDRKPYPPVKVDKHVEDGEAVTVGAVTLTAHITPGHTKGCTTWTFPVRIDGRTRQALVLCSLSVLPGYRLAGAEPSYPGIADDYRRSYATWKALPCEVFLASHGQFFGLKEKRAAQPVANPSPFVDPEGCRAFFQAQEAKFEAELARQQAAAGSWPNPAPPGASRDPSRATIRDAAAD